MYEARHQDGVTIIRGVGELSRPELEAIASLATAAREGGLMVVIDLRRVTHLHYAGAALLKTIPVVVLTTSRAEQDVLRSYELQANCYISKPVDLEQFIIVVRSIEDFWLTIVTLPHQT